MDKYIESISSLNTITLKYFNQSKNNTINNTSKNNEVDRYSEADIFWAKYKDADFTRRKIKKGQIFQFEFGKNFSPEMSYEHRGMVIGSSGQLLYVLPIFSYNSNKLEQSDVCHIVDNPICKGNYYLLKSSEFVFLKHDSVLKLNDIRTVSTKRIKYSQTARIDINSDTYKTIEKMVFEKYFGNIAYEYELLQNENVKLKEDLQKAKKEIENLNSQQK